LQKSSTKETCICKETCIFKHPTNRSHPIYTISDGTYTGASRVAAVCCSVLQCVAVCCMIYTRSDSTYTGASAVLQHTAAHCSTLQHTAAHCNTLQHTATHRNTVQHTATQCREASAAAEPAMGTHACLCAVHCSVLQRVAACSACCSSVLQCVAVCCTVLQRVRVHAYHTPCGAVAEVAAAKTGKTLQHTGIHCNTHHPTAPLWITVHRSASLCNTLHQTATHCTILQHTRIHCNTLHIPGGAVAAAAAAETGTPADFGTASKFRKS